MDTRAPEDFTTYVATHAPQLADTCYALTGNDTVARALQRELLARVALRWWRLRHRPEAAARHLDRLVQREARGERRARPEPTRRVSVVPLDESTDTDSPVILAAKAWQRAGRMRRLRLAAAAIAAALVGALILLGSNHSDRAPSLARDTRCASAVSC